MSLSKSYPFTTAGNYTYNASDIEVTGGVAKLKQLTYTDETFFADFTETINGRRGLGVLTGTASGGAAISGGYLDLTGGTTQNVQFAGVDNFDGLLQQGCIRGDFYIPYSGTPAADQFFCVATDSLGAVNNMIELKHASGTGQLNVLFRGPTGATLSMPFGVWNPSIGDYNLEFDFELTTGASRLFIDGVQFGSTNTGTLARTQTVKLALVGADYNAAGSPDFKVKNLQILSTVQNTTNFTPATSYYDYSASSPFITQTESVGAAALDGYSGTVTESGTETIGSVFVVDSVDKYWDGAAWSTSSLASESNTIAEVETNKASLDLSAGVALYPKWYLHSDGWGTPEIDLITLSYTFYNTPEVIAKCLVSGEFYNEDNTVDTTAKLAIYCDNFWHGEAFIRCNGLEWTPNSSGVISVSLIETETVGKKLKFVLTTGTGKDKVETVKVAKVPNQAFKNLSELMQGL